MINTYDDSYNGVMVDKEETPIMHKESARDDDYPPGVYNSCYCCGLTSDRAPKGYLVSYKYTKVAISRNEKEEKYVLTFCQPCYRDLPKP